MLNQPCLHTHARSAKRLSSMPPLSTGQRRSGRTCSCSSTAICVQAQAEGVRKQGQSPEARTMKVNRSILQHRTGCYHFPLSSTYVYAFVWFVHQACRWVSRRRGECRTCRGSRLVGQGSRAFCVWRDLPRFRPWLVL